MAKEAWKNYRNRYVYLRGKKLKLRKYIYVSANYMRYKNKKGWQGINHVQNYKNALSKYGFAGLKIYEDYFYKDIPLPENRTLKVRLALFLAPIYTKILLAKYKILKTLKLW